VLVVEDELLGLDLVDMLEAAGARGVRKEGG
jgi:hypothetical protein